MSKKEPVAVQRNFKDTVFRSIFKERQPLITLYNAVNGTSYDTSDDFEITTLENAVYINQKNDVSFLFQFKMNLYEHQSTVNPNMPLRDLVYITKQYNAYIKDDTIYSSTPISLPTPKFVVFYNGVEKLPERSILKLSDLFLEHEDEPELELRVLVLNINPGLNEEIKEACQLLKEYCEYVSRIRKYAVYMPIEEAVEKAVDECIKENILAEFLSSQRAEAIYMSILEYNAEEEIQKIKISEQRAGEARGIAIGEARGITIGEAHGIITTCKEFNLSKDETIQLLISKLNLSQAQALEFLDKY